MHVYNLLAQRAPSKKVILKFNNSILLKQSLGTVCFGDETPIN